MYDWCILIVTTCIVLYILTFTITRNKKIEKYEEAQQTIGCDQTQKLESAQTEIKYLQLMIKFLGSIARKESAINNILINECPGVYGTVPLSMDAEFNVIKRDIGNDPNTLNYFNNYFTKLSGIPSRQYKVIF